MFLSARDDLILNTRKLKHLHQYKHATKGSNSDLGGLPDVTKHIMSDPLQVPIVYLRELAVGVAVSGSSPPQDL